MNVDSSDGLNVGDVTGPRWAGGTRNPDDAEKAVSLLRMSPAERIMFTAGRASRDAEVEVLREQLAAAEARAVRAELEWAAADARTVLAEAVIEKLKRLEELSSASDWPGWNALNSVWNIIQDAPSSVALAAHDREVAARTLEDLAEHDGDWTARAWRPQEAETVVKMRKAILARAAALRSGTEGGTDV